MVATRRHYTPLLQPGMLDAARMRPQEAKALLVQPTLPHYHRLPNADITTRTGGLPRLTNSGCPHAMNLCTHSTSTTTHTTVVAAMMPLAMRNPDRWNQQERRWLAKETLHPGPWLTPRIDNVFPVARHPFPCISPQDSVVCRDPQHQVELGDWWL